MTPFQIEFIGIPGSGKSTISQVVLNKLNTKNYTVIDRQAQQEHVANLYRKMSKKRRLTSFLDFCENNNALVFELSRLSYALKPMHRAGLRRSFVFLKQCQNAALFRSSQNLPDADIVVHDQDILQELWSVLYLREASDSKLRPVISAMQNWLPDLTVFIDLNGKIALERMQKRAEGLNHFTGEIDAMENLDAKTLDRSNATTYRLGKLAQTYGSTLLKIDGLDNVEESARRVIEEIEILFDA